MNGPLAPLGQNVLAHLANAMLEAGRMAISYRRNFTRSPELKSQGNYVTEADYAIESLLRERLLMLMPEVGFVGEETASESNHDIYWVVDPIDGTGNYLVGLPYTISVALLNADKRSILGIVYNPQQDDLWWALANNGAFRVNNASTYDKFDFKMLKANSTPIILEPTAATEGNVIFGMPYDRSKAHRVFEYAERLFTMADDLKRIGSASLDICRVAIGQAKLYFELDLKTWDYAAAELILHEAGGSSTHIKDVSIFGSQTAVQQAIEILNLTN